MKITKQFNWNDSQNICTISEIYIYLHEHRDESLTIRDLFHVEDGKVEVNDEVTEFWRNTMVNDDTEVINKLMKCKTILLESTFPRCMDVNKPDET